MRLLRWVGPQVIQTATAAISGTGTFTATGVRIGTGTLSATGVGSHRLWQRSRSITLS